MTCLPNNNIIIIEIYKTTSTLNVFLSIFLFLNISITLDTYTHVLDSMKKKATQKLNDLYLSMGVKHPSFFMYKNLNVANLNFRSK